MKGWAGAEAVRFCSCYRKWSIMIDEIKRAVEEEFPQTVQYRRYFHQHPEISFQEEHTADYIRSQLQQADIPFVNCGQNGVVAKLSGRGEGPSIAFRADFDALAIQEPAGLPFASEHPGTMHACGHDAHAAVLLSLARIFAKHREWLKGDVTFIFQYAEEIPPGGAGPMIEDGCLDGVDRIYGMHVSEELETGEVGVYTGGYMAATDRFIMEFLGSGGHGSRPSETQDTISAAATAVSQINAIVSRFLSSLHPAIISVCNIHGGNSYNVIPLKVYLEGTVRTYEEETAQVIRGQLEKVAHASAELYGTDVQFTFERGYPVVHNTQRESEIVREAARRQGIPLGKLDPTPVGEDFARYLQKVPGAFFRVGIRNESIGAVYPLHNSHFALDEAALSTALQVYLGIYLLETKQLS